MSAFKKNVSEEFRILRDRIFKIEMDNHHNRNVNVSQNELLFLSKKLDDFNIKFNLLLEHLEINIEEKSQKEKEKDNIPYKIKVKGD